MTLTTPKRFTVELPWPEKVLSPNARVHWSRKARAVKSARSAAYFLTRQVTRPLSCSSAKLTFVFCPPDNRRRDRDNLIASMKAATDGISDAIGIDDSKFDTSYSISSPIKGGLVRVTLEEAA